MKNIDTGAVKLKMRALFVTWIILTAWPAEAFGQNITGARAAGLGQAVTALPDNVWSAFQNPAMLPAQGRHVSLFSIRYYGISELTDAALSGVYATGYGSLGVGLHSYGFDLYRESQFRLAYMRAFDNYRMGATLRYQHVSIEGYGSAGSPALDIGFAMNLAEGLWLGARTSNLSRSTIGEAGEELPRELVIGLSYALSGRVLLVSDLFKDVRFPFSYRGGVEVDALEDILQVRGGVSTEPTTFSLGFGLNRMFWSVSLAAQHHEWLGWSPGVGLNSTW